ncbi:MAG: hypothetical protein CMI01_06865 [Oceanospirillaceae bacterium]|nr:hypothetical protein [Oceanospirillaceae bacterium]
MRASSTSFSNGFSPLEIRFKPGRRWAVIAWSIALAAITAVLVSGLLPWAKLAAIGVLCLLLTAGAARGAVNRIADAPIQGLRLMPDQREYRILTLTDAFIVDQIREVRITPWLIAVNLKLLNQTRPVWVMLCRDQVSAEQWRRLSVVLSWAPPVVEPQRDASGQG